MVLIETAIMSDHSQVESTNEPIGQDGEDALGAGISSQGDENQESNDVDPEEPYGSDFDDESNDDIHDNIEESEEEDEIEVEIPKKRRKPKKSEFIDDEAELSGDDEVSEDEAEKSDDDQIDTDLVDLDAAELNSDQEEEVRNLYHKQLETEDKRALLLLQEQFDDKDIGLGQRRRKKFRWQTRDIMENSLKRHYDPDEEEDSDESEDDDMDIDLIYGANRGLRRPTAEALLLGSTKTIAKNINKSIEIVEGNPSSNQMNEESNSNFMPSTSVRQSMQVTENIDRFLFRDRELVQALSTKEIKILSREDKDRNIAKELKRVLTSKSIFDEIYS